MSHRLPAIMQTSRPVGRVSPQGVTRHLPTLCAAAIDWPCSSFRRYLAAGVYAADWDRLTGDLAGIGWE